MDVSESLSFEEVEGNGANKLTKEKLPHDLVIEILSWLHIKHLCPLRFVSKSWFHLLTKNPQFAKLQFQRFKDSRPDPCILAIMLEKENPSNIMLATEFTSCDKAVPLEFPFHQPIYTYWLTGISNGLLGIVSTRNAEVYIWNPLINDHITISGLLPPSIRFPGYKAFTKFGFGFDQVSNVYKVVRFFCETEFDQYGDESIDQYGDEVYDSWTQISVYTIGVDSMWRTVEVDIPHDLTHTRSGSGITIPLVNGVFHWNKNRPGTTDSWDLIVTFDLKEEVIGEFMLPHCIKFDEIAELGGFLCAIDNKSDEQHTQIWVMKEYGVASSWSKQYVIVQPQGYMFPLGVTHNGEIILINASEKLLLYNPETSTMKDLKQVQVDVFILYAFLGSIISPTALSQGHIGTIED